MGRKVNVVLPGGRVVSVDEDLAAQSQLPTASTEAEADIASRARTEEATSGFGQGVAAAGEGLADTLTGGAYGWAAGEIDPAYGQEMAARAEERSGSRFVGSALGVLAPTGLLGRAAQTATALTVPGLASKAGVAIGGLKGVAAEGAVLGLGGYIAESNVTGDPLTIEGAALSAGLGGLVDVGIVGGLGKIAKRGVKAQGVLDDIAKADADKALVQRNEKLFEDSATYDRVREANNDLVKHLKEQNAEISDELNAYAEALDPSYIKKTVGEYRKVHHEILADINATPYGRQVSAAARKQRAAIRDFEKQTKKFETWANDTDSQKGLTASLNKFQKAIDQVADRHGLGPKAKKAAEKAKGKGKGQEAPEDIRRQFATAVQQAAQKATKFGERKAFISSVYENIDPAFRGKSLDEFKEVLAAAQARGDIQLSRADLVAAMDPKLVSESTTLRDGAEFHFVTFDQPSAELAAALDEPLEGTIEAELKGYREKLSRAAKMVAGGYDTEARRWIRSGDPQDIQGALQDLHDLRKSLSKYTFIKKPNLPDIPVRPEDWKLPTPEVDVADARLLSEAAVDLDRSIERAREFSKSGDYGAAIHELRAVESRVKGIPGMGDLSFPELPPPPRALFDIPDAALPKSLKEFARKTPEKVAEWGQFVAKHDDGSVGESLGRLADELGLGKEGTGQFLGVELHGKLQPTLQAIDRLGGAVAEEAPRTFLGATKEFAKNATANGLGFWAFGAAGGGVTGAVAGSLARTSVRRSMSAVDGSLMAAKENLRKGVAQAVARIGRAAEKGKRLAPVATYLTTQFLTGDPDDETDLRQLANRRMDEVIQASINAPDAAFLNLEPLLGHPGDVGGKLHDWVRNAFGHLINSIPKDPGLDITPKGSNWRPSHQQAVEMAHRIEAVVNPLDAVERTIRGEGHPAAAETLWAVYPAMMQELAAQYAQAAADLDMTYEQGSYVSQLFRVPMTGLQQPLVATALQGLYLPSPEPQQGSQPSGPGGRPPRVQSEVAGSSVAGLIS